jgi:pimeloyl-ACP methyl ester carboxylesterase
MPLIHVNGTDLFYEDTGPGSTGETIVFSHGLLFSSLAWESQTMHLRERYRCIAYDHRGQGRSAECDLDSIDMERVYDDAVSVIDQLVGGPVHFCGLSMGGFVGMRLAARKPRTVRSLMLLETSADPEPQENVPRYRLLANIARLFGVGVVADRVEKIMFSKTFLNDPSRESERAFWRARLLETRRSIHRAVRGVVERRGVYDELGQIEVPTLVLVGEEDVATVPAKAERIHAAIRGSRLIRIPGAGHSSAVEQPARVNAALDEFLQSLR